jgi:hypothetical protein
MYNDYEKNVNKLINEYSYDELMKMMDDFEEVNEIREFIEEILD